MQIFSDLSATTQTQGTADVLPFSFGMTPEQGQDFYDLLQQTITDLEQGSLDNSEIAEKLAFIEDSIPEELMTKIEKDLNIDTDKEDKTDELSAKAFAVLNLVDNIVENIDKIKDKSQLEASMLEKGVSEPNIKTTIQMLEPEQINTQQTAAPQDKALDLNQQILAQKAAEKFAKASSKTEVLNENILTGKEIIKQPKDQTEAITKSETPANTEQTSQLNSKTESPKAQTLNEMLSMFKKTKSEATLAGLDLNKSAKTNTENTQVSEKTTTNPLNLKPETTVPAHTAIKTNGEINKSEFKELNSKIAKADISEDSDFTPKQETTTEELKPTVNNQKADSAFTNINKATVNNINTKFETADFANIEQVNTDNNTIEEAEQKLPSNFNHQLYKIAQQANVQNQVNVALKTFKDQKMQQLKIKLNPEELGNITIDMEMIDSVARGVITVERAEVAQHLAQNLKDIFQNFKQAGINVDIKDIVVKIEDHNHKNESSQQEEFEQSNTSELEFSFSEDDLVDIQV